MSLIVPWWMRLTNFFYQREKTHSKLENLLVNPELRVLKAKRIPSGRSLKAKAQVLLYQT